jgi:succinate dehydrogenase / fumarate reductase cytochrome b subunit
MGKASSILGSTIGKKFVMAATGLALVAFVLFHLSENLVLLFGTRELYNQWTHILESMAPLLYVAELILLAFFVFHIISGIQVYLGKRRSRPESYAKSARAGGPSRRTTSSVSMIFTGLVLGVFLVIHIVTFKYGPNVADGYVHNIDGVAMRDMYRLVVETFAQPQFVLFYSAVMILLGLHLRHGIWSAFQSLGTMKPSLSSVIYGLGVLVAILVGLGFLVLPVWIYFGGGGV